MKNIQKSVSIWYSAQEMYDLVIDVPAYPKFLPWCSYAKVIETLPDGLIGEVGIGFKGVKQSFTTRNIHKEGESVTMKLVKGPFSSLLGTWNFTSLPSLDPSIGISNACRIDFNISYQFSNRALSMLIDPVFSYIASTFVDAFIKRADMVYGEK